MVLFPVLGLALNYLLRADSAIFFIEMLGVWTFGAYWLVKSREMHLSEAEFRALGGRCAHS